MKLQQSLRVLITCPPMLQNMDNVRSIFDQCGVQVATPEIVQTMTVEELKRELPAFDGWIIGDDPANREVFTAGRLGRLKAAVKWGVGVDNVDFDAARELGIPIANTPGIFGREVADMALGYVIALARHTHLIDRAVRDGRWEKPAGVSLAGRTAAIVGFGDIGASLAKRLLACDMKVVVYDPYYNLKPGLEVVERAEWPTRVDEADFLIMTCALTKNNFHMVDGDVLGRVKRGVRIVNVARGALIDESALIRALANETVHSAALDVFETEPLPFESTLRKFGQCIFGSHNGSNTVDAVERANKLAVKILLEFLGIEIREDPD